MSVTHTMQDSHALKYTGLQGCSSMSNSITTVMTFPLNGSIRTSPVKHNHFKHRKSTSRLISIELTVVCNETEYI